MNKTNRARAYVINPRPRCRIDEDAPDFIWSLSSRKATIYVRSTNWKSLAEQVTACRRFARTNQIKDVRICCDVVGGLSTPPNLRRLVREVTKRAATERHVLIVNDRSRLGRSMPSVQGLMEALSKAAVEVVFVAEALP